MSFFYHIVVVAIAAVMAITLHEAAHGYAAWALGDDTARRMGRLSLNPLRHVDRFGTILLPGLMVFGQLIALGRVVALFGWAKPVPVDVWKFRNPRRGMMLVAAAGPAFNFFLAWLGAISLHAIPLVSHTLRAARMQLHFVEYFIVANMMLGLFNLIPIPPLDGGRIAVGLLPEAPARAWAKLERAGIPLVLALLFLLPMALGEFGIDADPMAEALTFAVLHGAHALFWLAGALPFLPHVLDDVFGA